MNTIANAVTATLEDLHKSTSKSAVEHRQRTGGWFGKINEWLRWLAVSVLKHGKLQIMSIIYSIFLEYFLNFSGDVSDRILC